MADATGNNVSVYPAKVRFVDSASGRVEIELWGEGERIPDDYSSEMSFLSPVRRMRSSLEPAEPAEGRFPLRASFPQGEGARLFEHAISVRAKAPLKIPTQGA
jgi:hypothetical protein